MKIYVGKKAAKLYLFIGLIFAVVLGGFVGIQAFMNRGGEYYTEARDNGDLHVRVRGKVGKEVELPKEYQSGIIGLYEEMKIYDVWMELTPNNEVINMIFEATSDNPDGLVNYYEDEKNLLDKNYEVSVSDHGEKGFTIRVDYKE